MWFVRYNKLEIMCLNTIIKHMHFYMNNPDIPEEHIIFLRQVYSKELFQLRWKSSVKVSELCLWLLSPYWKDIRLHASAANREIFMKKLQAMGSVIKSISVSYSLYSVGFLTAMLCCLPNIVHLNLSGSSVSNTVLLCIKKMCPFLVDLNISNSKEVTDEGMAILASDVHYTASSYLNLKCLDITGTSVSKKGIATVLKGMPVLQVLRHKNLSVILSELHQPDEDISYNLREFLHYYKPGVNLSNILRVWTRICPLIESVTVNDHLIGAHLDIITKFQNMKILRYNPVLRCESTLPVSFSFLNMRSELFTVLSLKCVTISVKVLTQVCKNLKYLNFCRVKFEDFEVKDTEKNLNKLNNLYRCNLDYVDFSAPAVFKSFHFLLSKSKNLEILSITNSNNVNGSVADVILISAPKLREVDFSFTDIRSSSLLKFFEHETMDKIKMDACIFVPNQSLQHFMHYKQMICSWHIGSDDDDDDDEDDIFESNKLLTYRNNWSAREDARYAAVALINNEIRYHY